ncbi:MAG: HAMP domain-containing protein [Desulfurivibrio sp.]
MRLDLGLRAKFFAGMFGIVFLLGVAMLVVVKTSVKSKLIATLQQRGVDVAQHIAANAVNLVLTERLFQLGLMLHELEAGDEDLLYIFIVDDRGKVLAHTFSGGFPGELIRANQVSGSDRRFSVRPLSTERGEVLDIAVPLLQGTLGEVRLGLSEARVQKDVEEIIRLLLWLIGGVLVIGMAAAAIFDLIITKPILRLVAVVKAVERGEVDQRADLRTSDEIGILGKNFDRMIDKRCQAEREREKLIAELQNALGEIKTLQGIIPICAACKKIRDDQGYWGQVESFIKKHTHADLSHGICPDCARKLYPDFFDQD